MHRFYLDSSAIQNNAVYFPNDISSQIKRVLRLRIGDEVIVFNGDGVDYKVILEVVDTNNSVGSVISTVNGLKEPEIFITLYQALIRPERYEYALQKGVEVGISKFVPFTCERTEFSNPGDSKITRWERIIKEASEQSGRSLVPELSQTIEFSNLIANLSPVALIPWEEEKKGSIGTILSELRQNQSMKGSSVDIVIGPVGGFTSQEVSDAVENGAISVSLGGRILRAETAGIVAAVSVLYEFKSM
ncbi:MAG: RsmE family RNA methyltransferase [Chloroflexota bacterium]|nr:RsmE family RNA methyltransferase [Chloroflexota bacterium]